MLRFYDSNNRDVTRDYDCYGSPNCIGEPWCSAWGICSCQITEDYEPSTSTALATFQGSGYSMEQEAISGCGDDIDDLFLELSQQLANEEV